MAFTRYKYDDIRIKKELQESTGSSRWILNTPGAGTDLPYFEDPHIRLQKWGANIMNVANNRSVIDISSDLDGRNRKASKNCVEVNYPNKIEKSWRKNYRTEKSFTDETRTSHPAWLSRDLEQTRWEYPIFNPQENVCKHFENNINTRILEKDNHRPIIPIVK
jgi:hypothetical protein